jgi:hypothetical protein
VSRMRVRQRMPHVICDLLILLIARGTNMPLRTSHRMNERDEREAPATAAPLSAQPLTRPNQGRSAESRGCICRITCEIVRARIRGHVK